MRVGCRSPPDASVAVRAEQLPKLCDVGLVSLRQVVALVGNQLHPGRHAPHARPVDGPFGVERARDELAIGGPEGKQVGTTVIQDVDVNLATRLIFEYIRRRLDSAREEVSRHIDVLLPSVCE
jgi:hypothetical protein